MNLGGASCKSLLANPVLDSAHSSHWSRGTFYTAPIAGCRISIEGVHMDSGSPLCADSEPAMGTAHRLLDGHTFIDLWREHICVGYSYTTNVFYCHGFPQRIMLFNVAAEGSVRDPIPPWVSCREGTHSKSAAYPSSVFFFYLLSLLLLTDGSPAWLTIQSTFFCCPPEPCHLVSAGAILSPPKSLLFFQPGL